MNNTPILFIHNVTGFMVGTKAERGGIIKAGSQMINAVSNSGVPHLALVLGASYGAGNYAFSGRSYKVESGKKLMFLYSFFSLLQAAFFVVLSVESLRSYGRGAASWCAGHCEPQICCQKRSRRERGASQGLSCGLFFCVFF